MPLFQTQTDDIIIEHQEGKIKRIEEVQEIEELNSKFGGIYSLIEIEDKRIS